MEKFATMSTITTKSQNRIRGHCVIVMRTMDSQMCVGSSWCIQSSVAFSVIAAVAATTTRISLTSRSMGSSMHPVLPCHALQTNKMIDCPASVSSCNEWQPDHIFLLQSVYYIYSHYSMYLFRDGAILDQLLCRNTRKNAMFGMENNADFWKKLVACVCELMTTAMMLVFYTLNCYKNN